MSPLLSAIHVLMRYAPKAPMAETIIKTENQEQPESKTSDSTVALERPNTTEDPEKPLPKIQPPAQLSLNNLAHGFQAYANQRKQQVINEPSLDISEVRFLEKLIQCIITQLQINRHNLAQYASGAYTLHCAISLARNGIAQQIAITKTSGNIFLDSLIKSIVQDGSGSFPPVPNSIKRIPYMLIFDIKVGNYISLQVLLPK